MHVRPEDLTTPSCTTSCSVHRLNRASQMLLVVCVVITCTGLMCPPVRADIPMSEYIRLYFEQDGSPCDEPVRFDIACYGYRWDPGPAPPTRAPGSYQPETVYRIRGNCPNYGCRISHSFYLNYIHIDYCDLVAQTEGWDYTLPRFASAPVDLSTCDGMECSLRVDLVTSAVLPVSAVPPPSDTPPSFPFDIADSRTYEEQFLIALLFTLLIEVPILFAMARFAFRLRAIGMPKLIITGVLASSLTLPCLWFIAPAILGAPYALIVGEILVFLVEAGIYALVLRIGIRRALLISFIANLASLALGLVLL
jgi:hypothetical protein